MIIAPMFMLQFGMNQRKKLVHSGILQQDGLSQVHVIYTMHLCILIYDLELIIYLQFLGGS